MKHIDMNIDTDNSHPIVLFLCIILGTSIDLLTSEHMQTALKLLSEGLQIVLYLIGIIAGILNVKKLLKKKA